MTERDERIYIADRVRDLLNDVRKGEARLLAEKLEHIAELLERPGWHKNTSFNAEDGLAHDWPRGKND